MPGFAAAGAENALLLRFSAEGSLVLGRNRELLNPLLVLPPEGLIYVAHWNRQPVFVHRAEQLGGDEHLMGLRELAAQDEDVFALAGRAMQLVQWQESHRFCGKCGHKTQLSISEQAMHCLACDSNYYPRLMPCVMALVVRGEHCLLARHRRRNNWWTTLAGFVEAGESAEQAIYREVLEEVALEPRWCRYVASQAWPFPGQLMLGFVVGCAEGELLVEPEELEEARWFHRDALPIVPPSFTLSGRLIEQFRSGVFDRED